MTREEAFKICENYDYLHKFADCLIELGVLKVEEVKKDEGYKSVIQNVLIAFQTSYGQIPICAAIPEILASLDRYGWKIVSKSKEELK